MIDKIEEGQTVYWIDTYMKMHSGVVEDNVVLSSYNAYDAHVYGDRDFVLRVRSDGWLYVIQHREAYDTAQECSDRMILRLEYKIQELTKKLEILKEGHSPQ